MVDRLIIPSIRIRGKFRWSRSIRGSIPYLARRVHLYGFVGKLLQKLGQTSKLGFQNLPLRKYLSS